MKTRNGSITMNSISWTGDSSSGLQWQHQGFETCLTNSGDAEMERWKGQEAGDQAFDQQNRALEDWQLPNIEALWQEQCWLETFRVIS